jgi:hypothetical protein
MSTELAVHTLGSFDVDIVVDLGCIGYARSGSLEDSIETLVKRFKPGILFGFDPHPGLTEKVGRLGATTVITSRRAAWTHDGYVGLEVNGNCTHVVGEDESDGVVRCFDLADWMLTLPDANIILKMDIEGAEYVLLPFLTHWGVMDRVSRLLVEWHKGDKANGYQSSQKAIVKEIKCPIEEWQ